MSTRSYVPFLREAKSAGYVVELVYIWLSSVELALSRVRGRVAQGGHDIPAATVERRYHRGLRNLFDLYLPLCDLWTIADNSDVELVTIADKTTPQQPAPIAPWSNASFRSCRPAVRAPRSET